MAVTIRQIALVAGVSRGTVDRVLHNRPGVKPEIAEHVRRIASELGFEPNRAGKILAARKQPLKIGCFLPGVGNLFFEDVVRGFRRAEAEFSDFGLSACVSSVEGYDIPTHMGAIRALAADGCAGLCVSTADVPEIRRVIDEIVDSGVPVVAVNTDLTGTKRLCYVGCNYLQAGHTAAGLLSLMASGRLELLIVTGSLKIRGHNDRIRGFSRTLREKRVAYHVVEVFESQDNDVHAYRMTKEILSHHPEINCVYIAAAGVAGVCKAVAELGLQPRILAYDETADTRRLLLDGVIDFTVGQEPEEQGYRAIQILFDYFMSDRKAVPPDYITKTVIKIRENLD